MLFNCLPLIIIAAIRFTSSARDGEVSYKTLQGEPSEFMNFSIPLKDREEISTALALPVVYLSAGLEWKYAFPVDPVDSIVVSVLYNKVQMNDQKLTAVLIAPDGTQPNPDYETFEQFALFGDMSDAEVLVLQFLHPKPGKWQLVLSIKGHATINPIKSLAWIAFNNSKVCISSYTDRMDHLVDEDMDMHMMVADPERKAIDGRSIPLPDMLQNATMTVTYPNGKKEVHVMYKEKTPGMMGGKFRPPMAGNYTVQLEVTGMDKESGYEFARSLSSTLSIAAPSLNVTGSIFSDLFYHPVTGNEIILIQVGVKWDPQSRDTYRGYAEVYGTGKDGESVPVAWVGGLLQVKWASSSSFMLQFELDSRWLVLANATFPLALHNLTFEEIDGFIEVVKVQQFLKVSARSPLIAQWRPTMKASDVDITYEMRNGYSPYRDRNYLSNARKSASAIVLVHGFCAIRPPFPSEQFRNPAVFKDLLKSRTIHEFAKRIYNFTVSHGLQRFSIVAHSQGGMAALHMLAYFYTPLDGMVGHGRVIQSVGTPYRGTPAALFTLLFDLLGPLFPCGYNGDLSVEGAERWQRCIPSKYQKEVFYYTTQTGERFSRCYFLTSLRLSSPNDGVVERERARLPFGTHVSDASGECHLNLPLCSCPTQTGNKQRNAEMDREAAR